MTKVLSIRVPEQLFTDVQRAATAQGVTQSKLAENALIAYLAENAVPIEDGALPMDRALVPPFTAPAPQTDVLLERIGLRRVFTDKVALDLGVHKIFRTDAGMAALDGDGHVVYADGEPPVQLNDEQREEFLAKLVESAEEPDEGTEPGTVEGTETAPEPEEPQPSGGGEEPSAGTIPEPEDDAFEGAFALPVVSEPVPQVAAEEAAEPDDSGCKHSVRFRIGKKCGLCGAEVK